MDTKQEIETTRHLVEELLRTDPRTRNSDKFLIWQVLTIIANRNGSKVFIPFECFEKFPAYESISRVRREIQNNRGLYPATDPNVTAKRAKKQNRFRKEFGRGDDREWK